MMDSAYFVIAILGCSDGAADCTRVATIPAHYASEAACTAATRDALAASTDFDFPTIVAECQATRPVPAADRSRPKSQKRLVPAAARRG